MKTLFKKPKVTPTHEERIAEAEALKVGALDIFDQAIRDLELAEALHIGVQVDIAAEIAFIEAEAARKVNALHDLDFQAYDNAVTAGAKAEALRQLIGA